jgi:methylmalonyl-CoA/ethylmalonyl-CoA epimerase
MGVGNTGSLHHSAWVVKDIEETATKLAHDLSITWHVWTITPEACSVHGEDVPYSFKVAIARLGDSNLELIEPLEGRSVYVEHLETRGEGFHHTCIIYPSRESMHLARDELASQGREMIQHGDLGDLGEFCYFPMPEQNSVLEVLNLSELPPPEAIIGS